MIEKKGKFELCIILWVIFTTKYLLDRGLQKSVEYMTFNIKGYFLLFNQDLHLTLEYGYLVLDMYAMLETFHKRSTI